MAFVFKCKCCTGNLDVTEGMYIVECDYCGTKQTVPSSRDENIQNLFNRATTLRLKSEFDKAADIYEHIIQSDEEQSEAYWGLILCKFGVEYVEDPKTLNRIPTCHRTSYESVIADENYKLTLKYAYEGQKAIYEEEAKAIDKVQKGILAVAQNEEPYDVFICYKETDANGKRTQDSVIANDIYHQLTQEGFKVFYAAITLEGKLGSAYEPIIFAALNSAKVMLAIGTRPEYFNSVWVKNEWSRFLKINRQDRNKLLIPCYKDMDAYDLPEEFAHLQAQDMSKIGFINDVVRGIKKVIQKTETPTVGATVAAPKGDTANLLKRAYMFLNDGDFMGAKEYCNKVLDIDAENSEAYLYSLLVRLGIKKKEYLCKSAANFSDYPEYRRAYAYGNAEQQKFLEDALEQTKQALSKKAMAMARQQRKDDLCGSIQRCKDEMSQITEQNKKLKAEITVARKDIDGVAAKIKKSKIWAFIHLGFIVGIILSFVFMANAMSSYDKNAGLYSIFASMLMLVSIPMLIVSLVGMTKNHPNKYSGLEIFGFVFLMIFYNIVGIVFIVRSFMLSKDKICKKVNEEVRAKMQQVVQGEKRMQELEIRLEDCQRQLREFVGAE